MGKNIASVYIFALVERQEKIQKQKKKQKRKKRKIQKNAKTEGDVVDDLEMGIIEEKIKMGRSKFEGLNITKFMEYPTNVNNLAQEIKALDFA